MIRVATLLASLALGACSNRTSPPSGADGARIYQLQNCANCHGADGEGKPLGPPLRNLARFWTAEELARFFQDPKPFVAERERLTEMLRDYPAPMSRYDNLDGGQRLVLAEWVLGL